MAQGLPPSKKRRHHYFDNGSDRWIGAEKSQQKPQTALPIGVISEYGLPSSSPPTPSVKDQPQLQNDSVASSRIVQFAKSLNDLMADEGSKKELLKLVDNQQILQTSLTTLGNVFRSKHLFSVSSQNKANKSIPGSIPLESPVHGMPLSATQEGQPTLNKPGSQQTRATYPPLPPITPTLSSAVFTHRGVVHEQLKNLRRINSASGSEETPAHDYERLEFLGDAYVELFATRTIVARFPTANVGKLSRYREALVNNATLAGYTILYGLDQHAAIPRAYIEPIVNAAGQVNAGGASERKKSWTKLLGDLFEAYVAAIVLTDQSRNSNDAGCEKGALMREGAAAKDIIRNNSDTTSDHDENAVPFIVDETLPGFHTAQNWLSALWAPRLEQLACRVPPPVDPDAKGELSRRLGGRGVRIEYEDDRAPVTITGGKIFTIVVRLTGWGWIAETMGSGRGESKLEAGTRAAMSALENPLTAHVNAVKKEFDRLVKEEREREGGPRQEVIEGLERRYKKLPEKGT